MNRLLPTDLPAFAREYRFAGGRLARLKVKTVRGAATLDLVLVVRPAVRNLDDATAPVRLRLVLSGVEEYGLRKRPGGAAGRLGEVRLGFFLNQFFLDLDAWRLEPGEQAKVHDFRGSDAYAAGQTLSWEELPPKGR